MRYCVPVTVTDPATPADSTELARRVVEHFRAQQRDLPWRRTRDPYAVWVSEIMLQQTRVATVIPYFERWLARFPGVTALAAAPLDDVLTLWSGLGYYARARNLHRGAREVVTAYAGALPSTARELLRIPGIGRYTAGAISSIAHDEPTPVVDGNVARVLARVFLIEEDIKSRAAVNKLWQLAGELVPDRAPGDFNQGMMELGATICTPTSPTCLVCPVRPLCRAHATGSVDQLPVMPKRKKPSELPLMDHAALWIHRRGRVLLGRRPPSGLYGGLWELPQAETSHAAAALLPAEVEITSESPVASHQQTLSHRRFRIRVFTAKMSGRLGKTPDHPYDKLTWHSLTHMDELGVSSATRAAIRQYLEKQSWDKTPKPSRSSNRDTKKSSKASTSSGSTRKTTQTSRAPQRERRAGSVSSSSTRKT